jgi:Transcriptional regulator
MELRQLRYFTAVAEKLNFSEAAKTLFITQGTLSQQIKQLENELDVKLFERTSHKVWLTEAGEQLLPLAKKAIESSEECLTRIADLGKALTGTLNIGVTHSFSGLLTDTVKEFIRKYPGVQLSIYYKTATEIHEMLKKGEVDLILAFKPAAVYEDVISEPLFSSELSAIMRDTHPLADRKSLTLKDISRYAIALPGSGLQSRKAFDHFINVDTSSLDVRVEINEPNMIMDILGGTDMIGIMSSLATHYHPSLVAIPIEDMRRTMTGCIHTMKDAYRKRAASVFIEMLRSSAVLTRLLMEQ